MREKLNLLGRLLKVALGVTLGIGWFAFWIVIGRLHFLDGDVVGLFMTVVFMLLPMVPVVRLVLRRNNGLPNRIQST